MVLSVEPPSTIISSFPPYSWPKKLKIVDSKLHSELSVEIITEKKGLIELISYMNLL